MANFLSGAQAHLNLCMSLPISIQQDEIDLLQLRLVTKAIIMVCQFSITNLSSLTSGLVARATAPASQHLEHSRQFRDFLCILPYRKQLLLSLIKFFTRAEELQTTCWNPKVWLLPKPGWISNKTTPQTDLPGIDAAVSAVWEWLALV